MKTQAIRNLVLGTLLATVAATSKAEAEAPAYIPIQGYLTTATGSAVDGATSIRFRLYSSETAGTTLFEETKAEVNVQQGVFSVYLGDESPIDLSVFRDHPVVFVGIKLTGDASEMSPRLQLATAPYAAFAQYCGDAATLGGKTEGDFLTKTYTPAWSDVTGKPGTFAPTAHPHAWSDITSGVPNGLADGDNDALAGLSCADGKVVKRSGGAWSCGDDVDTDSNTTYSAGTGLNLAGTQFSVNTALLDANYLSSAGGTGACQRHRHGRAFARVRVRADQGDRCRKRRRRGGGDVPHWHPRHGWRL